MEERGPVSAKAADVFAGLSEPGEGQNVPILTDGGEAVWSKAIGSVHDRGEPSILDCCLETRLCRSAAFHDDSKPKSALDLLGIDTDVWPASKRMRRPIAGRMLNLQMVAR